MNELEPTMTRYLLGELSESEQSAFEARYFADPQVFNDVLKTESELVDSYVRGQLSGDLRERFERSYMDHPALIERVKFAAALTTRIDQGEESVTRGGEPKLQVSWWQNLLALWRGQSPRLRLSVALTTLLVLLGGIWIYTERRKLERETQAAYEAQQQREREQAQRAAEETRRAEESRNQVAVVPTPQPTPSPVEGSASRFVSLALIAGGVRGGDSNQVSTLIIQSGTTQARLLLNLKENNYPSYRASLRTIAGVEIFSQSGIKPGRAKSGASFVFTVPAHKLAAGDYVLTLRGNNPDGEVDDLSKSLFRVEKK
jgi:hypothetical protein